MEPLKSELAADARPVRVRPSQCSSEERTFMKSLIQELVEYNFVRTNPSSEWACAPLIVRTAGTSIWRFIVCLRSVN